MLLVACTTGMTAYAVGRCRAGEGRVTDQTPVAQPWRWRPLKLPHCSPFPVASYLPQWRGTRQQNVSSAPSRQPSGTVACAVPPCYRNVSVRPWCARLRPGSGHPTPGEVAMTTLPRTRCGHRLVYLIVTALAAGALITAAELPPQRARAQDGGAPPTLQAMTADEAGAGSSWCTRIPPGYAHPPVNATPLTLQLLQRSVEPVPATDGLIHLPYVAQVTNTQPTPYDIVGVVPVDPLAGFVPTG